MGCSYRNANWDKILAQFTFLAKFQIVDIDLATHVRTLFWRILNVPREK